MLDIIMACHNHIEYTIQAIEALQRNTVGDFKLTLVDDSQDFCRTSSFCEEMKYSGTKIQRIVPNEKIIEGNQNVNLGLKYTESNPVVFMAQNTFVEPGWNVVPLQIFANNEKVGLIGAKLLYQNGLIEHAGIIATDYGWGDIGRGEPGHRHSHTCEVPAVGFALVFINRDAFPDGMPEKLYPYGFAGPDDVDICYSVRKRGWKVVYCGQSCAYHIANAVRNKGEDYAMKVEECRKFFLSRWGTNGTETK